MCAVDNIFVVVRRSVISHILCADDGTLDCGRRSTDTPTDGGFLCSDPISTCYIFITYDSTRGITSTIQKRLGKSREI